MKTEVLKNCAVINDLTGYGRCALNVSVPIMSVLGVRVMCAPTAVLSNHTAFDEYYFSDLTDGMEKYFENWEKLDIKFHGIYTGFLGSERQVSIISDFIKKQKDEDTLLFVDPIMGDNGKLYSTYTMEMVCKMRELICDADIITPNLTEACFLTGEDYSDFAEASDDALFSIAEKLHTLGAKCVIITGVRRGDKVGNIVSDKKSGERFASFSSYIAREYCGTGDLFASMLCGYVLRGVELREAVKRASEFLCDAVELSERLGVSPIDGIAFEPILSSLKL